MDYQPEVSSDQTIGGLRIAILAVPCRQIELFLPRQAGITGDLPQIVPQRVAPWDESSFHRCFVLGGDDCRQVRLSDGRLVPALFAGHDLVIISCKRLILSQDSQTPWRARNLR